MGRLTLLAELSLRELWISFRLLGMLVVLIAAAAPVQVLPRTATAALADAPPGPLTWFAVTLAVALGGCSGVAAWSLARMRRQGTVAWLAVRAVPRPGVLLGWFGSVGAVVTVGVGASALLAWLSIGGEGWMPASIEGYAATVGAVGGWGLTAVGVGLLAGSRLRAAPAALTATLLSVAAGVAAALGLLGLVPEPIAGLAILARLDLEARPVAVGLESMGLALAAAAVLLLAASALLERADL